MIKTLLSQVKQYKKASILTPLFMLLEVVVDLGSTAGWLHDSIT